MGQRHDPRILAVEERVGTVTVTVVHTKASFNSLAGSGEFPAQETVDTEPEVRLHEKLGALRLLGQGHA